MSGGTEFRFCLFCVISANTWQSRNSVLPAPAIKTWFKSNCKAPDVLTNTVLPMSGGTEFRFCLFCVISADTWQSRNSVLPVPAIKTWFKSNCKAPDLMTNTVQLMSGGTEFRFCLFCVISANTWQSRNSVLPVPAIYIWLLRNSIVLYLLRKTLFYWYAGGTEFRFCLFVWSPRIHDRVGTLSSRFLQ